MGRLSQGEDIYLLEKVSTMSNLSYKSYTSNCSKLRQMNPPDHRSKRRTVIKGYICMLVAMLGYIASLSSAQVSGNKISIFIVNIFRFTFEILFAIICILWSGHSLKVARKDIFKLVVAAVFNLVYVTLFYLASTLLPVGNLDGIYGGIYIATTTFVDAVRQQISKWSVAAAVVAGIGLIFLTQPWNTFQESGISPCEFIDNNFTLDTSMIPNNASNISISPSSTDQWVSPAVLGYFYVTVGTLSTCIADIIIRSLLQTYTIYNFLFWGGIIQSVITGVILGGMGYVHVADLSFPSGHACLGFGITFIISMTVSHMLVNITFIYLPVSKAAMVTPVATIALYVIQRTLLRMFHPGHANAMEIFGIIAIVIAGILSPIVSILYEN